MVNRCKEMEQQYTENKLQSPLVNLTLKKNRYEINIIAEAMKKIPGLCYTTHLINCHHHHKFFNAVCNSTVNLAFSRLQPKRTKIQKIKQGTKNEGKCKESRRHQTKQCLIMLNRLPEDK